MCPIEGALPACWVLCLAAKAPACWVLCLTGLLACATDDDAALLGLGITDDGAISFFKEVHSATGHNMQLLLCTGKIGD